MLRSLLEYLILNACHYVHFVLKKSDVINDCTNCRLGTGEEALMLTYHGQFFQPLVVCGRRWSSTLRVRCVCNNVYRSTTMYLRRIP